MFKFSFEAVNENSPLFPIFPFPLKTLTILFVDSIDQSHSLSFPVWTVKETKPIGRLLKTRKEMLNCYLYHFLSGIEGENYLPFKSS